MGGKKQRRRPGGLRAEASVGRQLDDPHPQRLDDAPSAERGAERHGGVTREDDPQRAQVGDAQLGFRIHRAAGDQQRDDHPHGLLRVVASVAERIERRGEQLSPAEQCIDPTRARPPEDPSDRDHQQRAEHEPENRRHDDELQRRHELVVAQCVPTGVGDAGAREAAHDRVGRAGRQPPVPGDEVPNDRSRQTRQHDVDVRGIVRFDLDDLRERIGDVRRKDEHRHEVEECRPQHGEPRAEHARRDDRGDGVGGVVKTVDDVEQQRDRNADYDDERDRIHPIRLLGLTLIRVVKVATAPRPRVW